MKKEDKAIILIISAVCLLAVSIGVVRYFVCQYNEEKGKETVKRMEQIMDEANRARMEKMQWFIDEMNKDKPEPIEAPVTNNDSLYWGISSLKN